MTDNDLEMQNLNTTDDQNTDQNLNTEENAEEGVIVINRSPHDKAKWYVIHTYSGHEKKVAITLKQRVEAGGFTDRIFKIFIPQQQKVVISEGKKRTVDERLFPGYVMVNMIMDDDAWYIVRSTRGVTGFVGTGNNPTPLPESEVRALMKFTKMETPKFEAKFSVGDSVKIIDGPFKEHLGKVDEVNEEQGKVKVLISVFGREVPVELDFLQVSSI
ncbi:MAG TPA: transcription termination/antitermination protein NusG [Patescibacteria group bacterium]|nr:transcription termination/antitermination protein NusG [Patescibacteria group bacterium]